MLDQQHLPTAPAANNVSIAFDNVQTFTVARAGFLVDVDVNIKRGASTSESITLAIWTISGTSTLDTLLTQKTLTAAEVGTDFSFVNFDFGFQPQVAIGDVLAIELSSSAANTTSERYQWTRDGQYDDGRAFSQFPNGGVLVWSDDFHFKTYVDNVPTPASAALLMLLGVSASNRGCLQSRRRRENTSHNA